MDVLQILLIVASVVIAIAAVVVQARVRVHGFVDFSDFIETFFKKGGWYVFFTAGLGVFTIFAYITFPIWAAILYTVGYVAFVVGFAILLISLAKKKKLKAKLEKQQEEDEQEEISRQYYESQKPKEKVVTTNYTCVNCGDKIHKRTVTDNTGKVLKVEYFCESCGVTFEERELEAFLKRGHNVDANKVE